MSTLLKVPNRRQRRASPYDMNRTISKAIALGLMTNQESIHESHEIVSQGHWPRRRENLTKSSHNIAATDSARGSVSPA